MREEIGFIKANVHRFKILEFLKREDANVEKISKKLRIRKNDVEKTLKELEDKNLISKEKSIYKITDKGEKVIKEAKMR